MFHDASCLAREMAMSVSRDRTVAKHRQIPPEAMAHHVRFEVPMRLCALLLASSLAAACATEHGTATTSSAPAAPADPEAPAPPQQCEDRVDAVVGSGRTSRTVRSDANFADVELRTPGTVVIADGSTFAVEVEADERMQDAVVTSVTGETLAIESRGVFCTSPQLKVTITMPRIRRATLKAEGELVVTKETAASAVWLNIETAGGITFRGRADALEITIAEAGTVILENGSARTTTVTMDHSGVVSGRGFDSGSLVKKGNGGIVNL